MVGSDSSSSGVGIEKPKEGERSVDIFTATSTLLILDKKFNQSRDR